MDVIEKVHNVHEQMENFSQEVEAIFENALLCSNTTAKWDYELFSQFLLM